MTLRIRLHGEEYWFFGNNLNECSPITELADCDENGELDFRVALTCLSYAHYYSHLELVLRYGEPIAHRDDIEVIAVVTTQ